MSALQENHSTVASLGYQLIAVSPDEHKYAKMLTEKKNLDFALYSDAEAELIQAFGLGWKVKEEKMEKYRNSKKESLQSFGKAEHATLPNPGIYIIKEGKVVFQYVNPTYSHRMDEETLIAILSTL